MDADQNLLVRTGQWFILRILASIGLPAIFDKISASWRLPFDLYSLLSFLVISRILGMNPNHKAFLNADEFPEDYDFSPDELRMTLEVLAENTSLIQSAVGKNLEKPVLNKTAAMMNRLPVDKQSDERAEGNSLIDWISLVVINLLERILKEKYTAEDLQEALRDMMLLRLPDGGFMPVFKRTPLTDQLEEALNLPLSTQYISDTKFSQLMQRSHRKLKNFKELVQNSL